MRIELCRLLSFWGFAALSLVCGLLAWPQLSAAWPSIEERIDRFRRQPPLAKVALLVFVVGFIAYGSTKTNQVDQTSGTNGVEIVEGGTNEIVRLFGLFDCSIEEVRPSVTPADIACGWQLWEVRTNHDVCYTMPEGATMATNWWIRGAFEDCSIVRLGDCSIGSRIGQSNNLNNPNNQTMSFPFGSDGYSSAWALTWGKLRFALADTNTEIAAVGAPMSAVPHRSRLWSAADTNGSRLVTWENFALNRDTNTPVNAQIELRSTGDFIVRSNEVETVYRRLDPEDWDNDGWRNDDDPDPYIWEECWDNFWQYLPDGANTNVYYWVDIRPRWNSYIEFFGDGPSDLEDPCIWAKAGETYRVQLLIGKTYDVESDRPFDIVAKSDARVEDSNVESNSCTVVWPVTLTVAEGRAPTGRPRLGASWNDGGSTFHVLPDPPWLNGRIVWDSYCCGLQGDGTNFTYACDSSCRCEGCVTEGYYQYAGYELSFWSWPCGCHHVDDQGDAGVAIDFDKSVVALEDALDAPIVVLTCLAYGGTYGGLLSVDVETDGQLTWVGGDSLPISETLEPGEERLYEALFSPVEASAFEDDVVATASILEDFVEESHEDIDMLTVVELDVEVDGVGEADELTQGAFAPMVPDHVGRSEVDWASSLVPVRVRCHPEVTSMDVSARIAAGDPLFECNGDVYSEVSGNMDFLLRDIGDATFYLCGRTASTGYRDRSVTVSLSDGDGAADEAKYTVYACFFIAYVDRPGDGSNTNKVWVRKKNSLWPDVGHAFWEMRCNPVPTTISEIAGSPFLNRRAGLYGEGLRLPDLDHQPEVTKTFPISKAKFLSGLRFCEGFRANTPEYDLSDYNCCNATIDAANACGVWIRRTPRSWTFGGGLNPTSLANDLVANSWHYLK